VKIVVIDYDLPDFICDEILDGRTFEPLNEEQFKEWLSAYDKENIKKWLQYEDSEIYFVDVKDKTWNRFKTKNSKRVELDLDGLMKLINEATYLIRIKRNKAELCTYYPEDDDP